VEDLITRIDLSAAEKQVVNTSDSAMAWLATSSLGHDVPYLLSIYLATRVLATRDRADATFARADFTDGLVATVSLVPGADAVGAIVPEPSAVFFVCTGLVGLLGYGWRYRRTGTT
jgi:hypothetical protein